MKDIYMMKWIHNLIILCQNLNAAFAKVIAFSVIQAQILAPNNVRQKLEIHQTKSASKWTQLSCIKLKFLFISH